MIRATLSLTSVFLLAVPLSAQEIGPRSLEEIQKTLKTLLEPGMEENGAALAKLKAFRYLAGVPWEDIELDEIYNKYAQAGSKLCQELGRLEHNPKNPGWPEEEFKIAFKGTSSSNLGAGFPDLVKAVDGWMYDSDKFNISHLGHRRWCINPTMKKVGFGRAEKFTAMYSFDMSRAKVPDYEFVAFPGPGYMPAGFFSAREAWSVSFNPGKYMVPAKGARPSIYPVDEKGEKGAPLELDFTNVDFTPFAIANCVIFRPAELDMKAGRKYLVEVQGIQSGGKDTTVRYQVEFAGK